MFDRRRARWLPRAAWVLVAALSIAVPPANADALSSADVMVRTGRTIDAWAASWWQWAFMHPEVLGDTSGTFGPEGDVGGPVFFAEGSGGGIVDLMYAVPAREFVLLPLATYLWTLFDPCADSTCAAAIVDAFVDGTTAPFATIDGLPVPDLASHVVRADPATPLVFQVDAGPIDATGYGGLLDAVEAGYWLMIEPLAPGPHMLSFGATVPLIDAGTGEPLADTVDLRTNLIVAVVPEPDAAALLVAGIAALAIARRRSRVAQAPRRFNASKTKADPAS